MKTELELIAEAYLGMYESVNSKLPKPDWLTPEHTVSDIENYVNKEIQNSKTQLNLRPAQDFSIII